MALVLGADRILGRRPLRGQRLLHCCGEGRHAGVVLAHPLPELRHEGARERVGQRAGRMAVLQPRESEVRLQACPAPCEHSVGQEPQVLDQRELEHAGPRPELADRQRRNGLKGEDEAREPVCIEPSVAVPDQLERHRMDAGLARELACRELRQLPVVPDGEVVPHGARLRDDEMEVVEKPLGGRRNGDALVDVVSEATVGRVQDADVRVQPWQHVVPTRTRGRYQRQAGGERLRSLLEALEAQELAPERHGSFETAPSEHRVTPCIVFNISPAPFIEVWLIPGPRPGAPQGWAEPLSPCPSLPGRTLA